MEELFNLLYLYVVVYGALFIWIDVHLLFSKLNVWTTVNNLHVYYFIGVVCQW